jgi:transcriptional regulator with XRE-family HTH domain
MIIMVDFRNKVKEMCKLKGLQQKELAQKLGITDIGLSATLKKNNPQLSTMVNIAEALDVSLIELLSVGESQPEKENNIPDQGGMMRCPHCEATLRYL